MFITLSDRKLTTNSTDGAMLTWKIAQERKQDISNGLLSSVNQKKKLWHKLDLLFDLFGAN